VQHGDRINTVLAATSYNFSLLLRWFEELLPFQGAKLALQIRRRGAQQNFCEKFKRVLASEATRDRCSRCKACVESQARGC
jgi:hypothetical protein